MKKFPKIAIYLIIFIFLVLPFVSFGEEIKFTPLATGLEQIETRNLGTLVTSIFVLGVQIAGALAVIMIIWGGVEYMTTEAFTGKSDAKDRITQALYGLLLALCSYLILYTINPQIVNLGANCLVNPGICNSYSDNKIWQAKNYNSEINDAFKELQDAYENGTQDDVDAANEKVKYLMNKYNY